MMQLTIKYRSKFSALLLAVATLILPGIGQLFGGRLRRAIIFLMLSFLLTVLFITSGIWDYIQGYYISLLTAIIFVFYIAYDAFKLNLNVKLQWYNKWYFYLIFIVGISILETVIPFPHLFNHYRSFSIPNESNIPTLQIGDRIIAKMKYPISLIPSRSEYPINSLVIFNTANKDGKKEFIKRIVAQSGDRYLIKKGVAYLNNKPVSEPYLLAINNKKSESINFGPVIVPADSVLVLGDNRDNSIDSRYFGFVPTKNIIAKPLYIYWADDFHRIGLKFK